MKAVPAILCARTWAATSADGHEYSSRMAPGSRLDKGLPPCVSGLASGNCKLVAEWVRWKVDGRRNRNGGCLATRNLQPKPRRPIASIAHPFASRKT